MQTTKVYTLEEIHDATLKYFDGDELATNVWLTKYALKNKKGEFLESTPTDMHRRLAREFARIEGTFGGGRALDEEAIYGLLENFQYIVPQGSPMYGMGNDHVNVSLSNCVVVDSPSDNISSIVDAGRDLANLFKRRCGVGIDISELRPENTPVNNSAGTTTGAWSFADFYSYVCRMIGQNGRRGALMISMDVRHPDIEKFVTMKGDLSKVTGANVSVRISDDFMEAVEKDEDFVLRFPINGERTPAFTKTIKATHLWDMIVKSATVSAEPGILMWGNILKRLPANEYADQGFQTLTTNPCGEIPLSAYDSCRLISINLKSFVKNPFTEEATFDFTKFGEVVTSGMRLSDDLVELEIEKLNSIIRVCDKDDERRLWSRLLAACKRGRRTGLGTHGLADAVACMGYRYDSSEAIELIDKIYEELKVGAYGESVQLAVERGSFPVFDWDTEQNNSYISDLPKILRDQISRFGRRNISILTNAPTGSVSILSQTSSGVEPVFRNTYTRRRKLSHNEQEAPADYVDEMGEKWSEYTIYHHNVQEYMKLFSSTEIPDIFVTSDQIDWNKRVDVQAVIQNHIDHSISSTINLPKGTSSSVVGELYREGWRKGLKGITVYVDGSRSGVLVDRAQGGEAFPVHDAPQRPETLSCDIYHTTIRGEKWVVLVGLLDERPYEVMGGLASLIEIPKKYTRGTITKRSRKTTASIYDLRYGEGDSETRIKDLVKVFDNPNHSAFTRVISLTLRHGAKINFLVEQLQKDKDSEMFSFSRCIARVLKNYIQDGTRASTQCPDCGLEEIVYIEGCQTCKSCGYAKCG
jgi:ribonucleoside-diphosphate reductase alpha chain